MSLTVISIVVEISPAELFPQTVNVTVAVTAVGVPVMAPVALSKSIPAGKSSYESIDHKVGAPSVCVGAAALTILFLVNVYGEPGYEIDDGASSRTLISTVVESSPAGLLALIVIVTVEGVTVVGVPII